MGLIDAVRDRPRAIAGERTDDDLMAAVQCGSREAYLAIYDRYENAVYAYCRRVLDDHDRAADAFQEAFVRVWERSASYRGGNFEAWLFTIVRNLCRDEHARHRRHDSLEAAEEIADADDGPDLTERAALADALARLPEELREAIVLREYEGFSYREIAELTGQSLTSVGVRIFRAKQLLRTVLGPLLGRDR